MTPRAVDLIRRKRQGGTLEPTEIRWLVDGLCSGSVPDYQWAALLMAVMWRGMDAEETEALTHAMMHSGTIVDLSMIPGRKVDKHSTGGVGDKTSLVLAPIVASCGLPVPMVSGRGLGHTGGTLDKLESIPGFDIHLDLDGYKRVLADCGLVLIGQTPEIAPADKRIYALRDATATVESIPLLTSSILSKKLAEGIDGLVLDVKTGDGAFMESLDDSRALAESLCRIGRGLGKEVVALITRMDQPLGKAVGNAVEVAECVRVLRGEGPEDLRDLSIALAAEMLVLGGVAESLEDGTELCFRSITTGAALDHFRRVVEAQGGDPRAVDDLTRLPVPTVLRDVPSPSAGVVTSCWARPIGHAAMLLGAGRARAEDAIDPAVGILLHKKLGDRVAEGEPLCTVLANAEGPVLDRALAEVAAAFEVGDGPVTVPDLIVERL
ncbi:thymidine phosphorylase [Tautonia plasticadhaerens]|uniref:thymidine phosphorylase n=1 Tax=Tautonia plasticadhaerens TaxID=2527974 RepID=A0A518H8U3_9BACT|nr:thymidine phosphorylase [Tautonia plasticadhaerens]QDV37263.1 Pyrimidine-nucleoside phosphorylase [Tautonia plasticadhaerens]